MTISPDLDIERIEDQAATWLVELAERPDDPVLRARFAAWRAADGRHETIWARTRCAYDLIGQAPPRHQAQWSGQGRLAPTRRPARRRAVWLAAGAVAAMLAWACLPGMLLRLQATSVTAAGEVRVVTLADGSQVSLAPGSAIRVTFTGMARQVRLLEGEAFFEVVHDPARPFSVSAGEAVATVLGTGFDVRRVDDGALVAVQHGHVRVDDAQAAPPVCADLLAGDWVQVSSHGTARGTGQAADVAAWRQGMLIARNRRISDIVDELRAYYQGAIVLDDAAFASRRVSGLYDLRHPEDTLRDLVRAHGATLRKISPWLLLVTVQ